MTSDSSSEAQASSPPSDNQAPSSPHEQEYTLTTTYEGHSSMTSDTAAEDSAVADSGNDETDQDKALAARRYLLFDKDLEFEITSQASEKARAFTISKDPSQEGIAVAFEPQSPNEAIVFWDSRRGGDPIEQKVGRDDYEWYKARVKPPKQYVNMDSHQASPAKSQKRE